MKRFLRTRVLTSRYTVPIVLLMLAAAVVWSGGVLALPTRRSALNGMPRVYLDPNPIEVGSGLTRDVDIVVEDIDGLYAIEIRISYPNGLVNVVDADPGEPGVQIVDGNIFDGFDTYTIQNSADNSTGVIEYIVSITASTTGKTGSGTIATIPLHGVTLGEAVMSFVEVVLCERDGTSIPVDLVGQAQIDVVDATLTPTLTQAPDVTPTETQVPTVGPSPTTAPRAEVRVEPQYSAVAVGDTDEVQVNIYDVTDLYGFEGRIDYNGTLLDVEDLVPGEVGIQVMHGDVFDAFSYQVLQNEVTDDGVFGQIHFTAFINAGLQHGFDGDGTLFWMVFRGVTPGLTNVTISQMDLLDHSGTTIQRDLYHGEIEVLPAGPTSTPTETPSVTDTATLTPTATQTIDPAATPTATTSVTVPVPTLPTVETPTPTQTGVLATPTPVCSNRIENGGFETLVGGEALPWVKDGAVTYTTVEQASGMRSAWLGGYNNADSGICQTVTIPTLTEPEMVTEVTLRYMWGVVTPSTIPDGDILRVVVRDEGGTLLRELETLDKSDASGTWEQSTFDLSEFEGQTVKICFECQTDGDEPTSFYIDDVELIVCEILMPTPTATPTATSTISPTPTMTGLPTATPTITPTPVVDVFQYVGGQYENCWDAYLDSWHPTTNYGHTGALSIRTAGTKRPVLYFDVSRIPSGVTIMNASLELRATYYKSHSHEMTAHVYGLKREWVEMETTWQEARDGVPWTLQGADDTIDDRDDAETCAVVMPDPSQWYAFDITSLVQAWVDGARPNYGLMLYATGNTVEMSFYSSEYSLPAERPRLVVQYTYGSGPIPTFTPQPSVTVGASVSPTPTLTATPSGDVVVVQQGLLGYSGVEDTYLNQWDANTNYGRNVTIAVRQGGVKSSLVKFDLSSQPTAQLVGAELGMYAVSRTNAGNLTIDVYPALRPWGEEQANYFQATSSQSWEVPGCSGASDLGAVEATLEVGGVNEWHTFDVTDIVRGWLEGTSDNYGFVLKGRGPTSVEYTYAASEYHWALAQTPKLTLRFAVP